MIVMVENEGSWCGGDTQTVLAAKKIQTLGGSWSNVGVSASTISRVRTQRTTWWNFHYLIFG